MISVDIPGWRTLEIAHLVLDINGTLAADGRALAGVAERLRALASVVSVEALTAGTHGGVERLGRELGVPIAVIQAGDEAEQKRRRVVELGREGVAAIGNGVNDAAMLREAAVGIAVLGPEGAATQAVLAADVSCGDIADALDLLIRPMRLAATLRR